MPSIHKDTPLSEITLRRYEKPFDIKSRELIRKICLSIGLLQPGDSRDIIIDILYILLEGKNKGNKEMSCEDIRRKVMDFRQSNNLKMLGVAPSNIRRQLKRLKDIFIVEKVNNKYRINENLSLLEIFDEKIKRFMIDPTIERVRDYFKRIDSLFENG